MVNALLIAQIILGIILVIVLLGLSIFVSWLFVTKLLIHPIKWIFGKVPVTISERYLFSKKKRNAINLITLISIVGVSIVTASLIIILSIFNGFQSLIIDMFSTFDPDVKIVAAKGRSFPISDEMMAKIVTLDEVQAISPTIENKAIVRYLGKQHFVVIKGLKPNFHRTISPMDSLVYHGEYDFFTEKGFPLCILGGGVAQTLNANLRDQIYPIEVFAASQDKDLLTNPEGAMETEDFFVAGYFSVQMEYDNKFVLVDYSRAEKLFDFKGKATAYEIKLKDYREAGAVKGKLQKIVGPKMKVLTWYEQHRTLYEVMKSEKLVAYLVLTLVLILSGVNIVGSLAMIVLEKTPDIAILKSFGSSKGMIARIFLAEGFLVGAIGGFAGLIVALAIGTAQEKFGIVKLAGGDSFLIDAWPLEMRGADFLIIFSTVFGLALLASLFPAIRAAQTGIVQSLRR